MNWHLQQKWFSLFRMNVWTRYQPEIIVSAFPLLSTIRRTQNGSIHGSITRLEGFWEAKGKQELFKYFVRRMDVMCANGHKKGNRQAALGDMGKLKPHGELDGMATWVAWDLGHVSHHPMSSKNQVAQQWWILVDFRVGEQDQTSILSQPWSGLRFKQQLKDVSLIRSSSTFIIFNISYLLLPLFTNLCRPLRINGWFWPVFRSSAILTDEQLTLTNIHGSLSMLTDQQFILTNFHKYLSTSMDFQQSW